jgi:hypothetical protein
MNLDLRIPMGLLFTLLGVILSIYGAATKGSEIYARSLGYNANLDWGLVLLVFGATMYLLGRKGQRAADREVRKPAVPGTVRRGH